MRLSYMRKKNLPSFGLQHSMQRDEYINQYAVPLPEVFAALHNKFCGNEFDLLTYAVSSTYKD